MKNRDKRFAQNIIFTLIAAALLFVLSFRMSYGMIILFALVVFATSSLGVYSVRIYSQKLFKAAFILWVIVLIVEAAYVLLAYTGYIELFNDPEYLKNIIGSTGALSKVIFVLISFLQVTVIPIPSTITVIAGTFIFGMWESVLLSLAGIIAGSMFAFFLGRVFGVKLVKWIVGEEMLKKYQNITSGRDSVLLFFMLLLPMFPDDILCLIAGLTKMSYWKFLLMQIVARPVAAITTAAFMGEGASSIPFEGTGLLIWAAIGIATVLAFYMLMKYSNPAMIWIKDWVTRRRREKIGYGNINRNFIDKTVLDKVSNTQILRNVDVFYTQPKVVIKARRKVERDTVKAVINARRNLP